MKKTIALASFLFAMATICTHSSSALAQGTTTEKAKTEKPAAIKGNSHSKATSQEASYECKTCSYTSNKPGKCACGATLTKVEAKKDAKNGSSKKM